IVFPFQKGSFSAIIMLKTGKVKGDCWLDKEAVAS
ncbi:unnamed protein product, partial [marine sediment metagenome]